jgi:predicted transcriptional regulator
MSQGDTAKAIGVSLRTVARWVADKSFAAELNAEIQRRQKRLDDGLKQAANEVIDADIASFRQELEEYHRMVVNVQKMRMHRGKQLFDKTMSRFVDVPEEAIAIKDIPSFVRVANELISGGLDNWGDALAIQEVLERFDGKQD